MQLNNIPEGILSLFIYSLPVLKIPIIFICFFAYVESSGNKIFAYGIKIEFNKSKIEGDALLIPWNTIKFFGCSSSDLIAFNKSVSSFLTSISPIFDLSILVVNNNYSTLVDFEITFFVISKSNFSAI